MKLDSLFRRFFNRPRYGKPRRVARRRLCLECLEDRTVPSFAAPGAYSADASPVEPLTADFNNDSRLDLAVLNPSSDSVRVLLGNGDGKFQTAQQSITDVNLTYYQSLAAGDFNGDGPMDLVHIQSDGGTHAVSVLFGNGNGTFQAPVLQEVPVTEGTGFLITAGDVNSDGRDDIVAVNGDEGGERRRHLH